MRKKAIRHIHKLPLNHHTLSFFKSIEILKVPEVYNHRLGIHMYKFASNHDLFIPPVTHRYDTRSKNNVPIPRVDLSSQLPWHYRGNSLWNSLPSDLKY